MKKCSEKNEVLINVGITKKSQVVKKWFVKVPRSCLVSIRSISIVKHRKKCLFRIVSTINFFQINNARFCKQKDQYFGEKCLDIQFLIDNLWEKLNFWHYGNSNENKQKKIKFKYFSKLGKEIVKCVNGKNIIDDLLRCGDVEPNPGPSQKGEVGKMVTYNVRGIKEYGKLKRVLNLSANLIKLNRYAIINLQETHLDSDDINRVKMLWRGGFNLSPGSSKSRGCLTLWGSVWSVVESTHDSEGRICCTTLQSNSITVSVVNVYAPNDHNTLFFEEVFNYVIDIKEKYDSLTFLCGDLNLVLTPEIDSINRCQSSQEKIASSLVIENIRALQMIDCYRSVESTGGFTWNRGQCYSRLDMIFATNTIEHKIKEAKVDWAFDNSDHAVVEIVYVVPNSRKKGPGIPRLDASILDKEYIRKEIENKMVTLIEQIPITWDPIKKWEYIKVCIRSVFWEVGARVSKVENTEFEVIKSQLNLLKENKANLILNGNLTERLEIMVNKDIVDLENKLEKYRIGKSQTLAAKAKAKWFDEGEKSNKYFLNLVNKRKAECEITSLTNGDKKADNQKDLENLVKEYYENLYAEDKTLTNKYDDFFPEVPRLSDEERAYMDSPLTVGELEVTLRTCADSAPGPDGIVYSVYTKLWSILGKHLNEAWYFSKERGLLPDSQRSSSITLLPKEGKDLSNIANWRPITLTNCDLKIFTKSYANRMSLVLNKLIHPSQTAYIPGRSVSDNLRMFDFYKNYCNKYNVDAILLSLDARKAFDSVDHKYMFKTLSKYGFSDEFIATVKLLYNDIKADILVNGYRTSMIKICRCVKQGDALSCALFILCIDPLIRRIENNKAIEPVVIRTPLTSRKINTKCGAFADDVGAVVKNKIECINGIFKEYESFSKISGIHINETKTEIMPLRNANPLEEIEASCYGKKIKLKMVECIKICGIVYSNNANLAYRENVLDKINRLKASIGAWQFRGLSLSGKILVTKTFGISQLIYTMQVCEYKDKELEEVERHIFGNLWSKNINQCRAPDRIKRSILKQDYEKGGLKVPDIKNLNYALKLKQFLRANEANHVIKDIQKWEIESLNYDYEVQQEYSRLCQLDNVTKLSQEALNLITDKMRSEIEVENNPQYVVDLLASTDVKEYLLRGKKLLHLNFYKPLFDVGIETLKQLHNESVFPRSDRFQTLARNVLLSFPKLWINILSRYNSDSQIDVRENIPITKGMVTNTKNITVKMIRGRLLKELDSTKFTFEDKLGISRLDDVNPFIVNRLANRSEHMRMLKFRFLHCDIFCKQRMFKFKMSDNDQCDFCGGVETIKHLIWDCQRSKAIWGKVNEILGESGIEQNVSYTSLFTGHNPINFLIEVVVTKALQLIIQIDRSEAISMAKLKSELVFLGNMYKYGKQKDSWAKIAEICLTS
jgi:exonuclease III